MKGVNENDYSVKMQDYAAVNSKLNNSDLGNPDLVRWSKLTRPTLPANLASIIGNSLKRYHDIKIITLFS